MEIRKCKKCGCSLPSDSKKKLCESCRVRRNERIKKGLLITGSILLAILTLGGSVVAMSSKSKSKR